MRPRYLALALALFVIVACGRKHEPAVPVAPPTCWEEPPIHYRETGPPIGNTQNLPPCPMKLDPRFAPPHDLSTDGGTPELFYGERFLSTDGDAALIVPP